MKLRDTAELQQALGYRFVRTELLEQALTHTSHARESEAASASSATDNEQLEFLGDAVLGLITTEELCRRFPHFREGKLSKLRAHLVSEKHLIHVARTLKLGAYLNLGRGEEKSGGRDKPALLVDSLEAILAAIYIDSGLDAVRRVVVENIVNPEIDHVASDAGLAVTDYKSALQEKLQATARSQPSYNLVKERGPEHSKTFTVEVRFQPGSGSQPEFVGRAEGSTKKSAEQDAARLALEHLAALLEASDKASPKPRS
jgi:ribonuclease-3